MSEEQKDGLFDKQLLIFEKFVPDLVEKTKGLMKDSLQKFLDSKMNQITAKMDSRNKLAEKQFEEFLNLLNKAAELAQKTVNMSAEEAVKTILDEVSAKLKELGAPEDVQNLIANIPKLLNAGKTISDVFSDWRISKKELVLLIVSLITIIEFVNLVLGFFI
jgi:hypothetical protein